MPSAMVMHTHGGADVLRWEEVTPVPPGPGEILLRQTAIGLNYIDVYVRTGLYPLLEPPGIPGMEAAGVVEAVGDGVTGFVPGDRAAYVYRVPGAYAELRTLPAEVLVKLPDTVNCEQAAALMLKGMTAEYLLHRTHLVEPGMNVLVHAAAGGMGLLLCAWASHLGARVFGTVSTEAKAELARAHGCAEPILYTRASFPEQIAACTRGYGCDVVYDSVGRDTLDGSLECLAMRGHLVSFGQASGSVEPFDLSRLSAKSASVTRPTLFHYIQTRAEREDVARHMFEAVEQGVLRAEINQRYPLADAARAHRDLESRQTVGASVLLP